MLFQPTLGQTKAIPSGTNRALLLWRDVLRQKIRKKVENRRVAGGRVVQRHVLHLGEINDKSVPTDCERCRCFPRIAVMG